MLSRYYHQPFQYFWDECTEDQVEMLQAYMVEDLTGEQAGPDADKVDLDAYQRYYGGGKEVHR